MKDRYANPLTTASAAARDHYITGVDRLLAAEPDIVAAFEASVEADPGFALGHAGLARARQFTGDMPGAKLAMAEAEGLTKGLSAREAAHIAVMSLLVSNDKAAYPAIRSYVNDHPRDALIAQSCSSVFGLIGFSGRPAREAEILAYTGALMPHYGEDWWMLSQYAFALCENGDLERADDYIERSMALNPRNANGAHVRSHVWYESGDTAAGTAYLTNWLNDYSQQGYLHGHLSWHCALWSLHEGDVDEMWRRLKAEIAPGASTGPAINIMTDTASLLYRAEMAGVDVPPELWLDVSAYAQKLYPNPSIGFIDIHVALAHVMAGEDEPLRRFMSSQNAKTGDLVVPVASAWRDMAAQNWAGAVAELTAAMADHARLGGSRAQRDLLELALLTCLLRQGRDEEAKRLLALRRPVLLGAQKIHGLEAH